MKRLSTIIPTVLATLVAIYIVITLTSVSSRGQAMQILSTDGLVTVQGETLIYQYYNADKGYPKEVLESLELLSNNYIIYLAN